MLLAGQARQAIAQGDYRLAIALAERLLEHPLDLVVIPPGRTGYPAWRQAARLLDQLPAEGLRLYRQLYDAEAAGRLEEAARRGDIAALQDLFRTYRASTAWPAIGRELVAQLLDAGEFTEALGVVRLMTEAGLPPSPERQAQLVAVLTRTGQPRAARAALAALEQAQHEAAGGPHPEWTEWTAALRRDVAAVNASEASLPATKNAAGAAEFAPAWRAGAVWRASLEPMDGTEYFDDDRAVADAVERLGRLPLQTGLVDGGVLVVRERGTIWAYDLLSLTLLWRQRERVSGESLGEGTRWPWLTLAMPLMGEIEEDVRQGRISPDVSILLSHALRHTMSAGFGHVYTVESFPAIPVESAGAGRIRLAELGGIPAANELIARELSTGRLVWRRGSDPDDSLYQVAFQDCPVVVGEHLCVPFQRGDELHLALLDPSDGALLQEVPIVAPPTYFSPSGGGCLLAADDATIFVCTGNGVVAAVDRRDLSWRWATTYPSALVLRRVADWWSPRAAGQGEPDAGVERPLIADDLLVVAAPDSPYIIALDRFSGRQRWRIERGAYEFLVGMLESGLVVGGDRIACLDPIDGTTLRWRSVALDVTGRPVIRGQRIFVPTRDGIVVLDGATGRVVAEEAWEGRDAAEARSATAPAARALTRWQTTKPPPTANLVSTPEALFAVSPGAVVKYADVAATRQHAEAVLEHEPNIQAPTERARLALAWVQRLEGAHRDALATLGTLTGPAATPASAGPDPEDFAVARERLLVDLLVGLAGQSAQAGERLAWLRQALPSADAAGSESADMRQDRARLAILIGRALEDEGDWEAAARHYGELLRTDAADTIRVPEDSQREAAGWLYAASRLRDVLGHLPAEQVMTLLEPWLAEPAPATSQAARDVTAFWQRLRLAVRAEPWRERIACALLRERDPRLPPELRLQYLSATKGGAAAALSDEERRQLALVRWETHVALGMLAEATADRAQWQELQRETGGVERSAADEALHVRRLEAAQAALADALPQPGAHFAPNLVPQYQWKLEQSELLVDERHPLHAMRAWVPVRNLDERVLTLHGALRGRECRRTVDALERGPGATAAISEAAEEIFTPGEGTDDATRRPAWPVAVEGYLAAIPLRGGRGLACIGLGPERSAGRRLWEYGLPEWTGIPTDFADKVAAGPLGVYVVRRNDRVALIGWTDGRVWWQRDFPGMRIRQVYVCPGGADGGRVIVVGQDDVVSVDATWGGDLRALPVNWGTPRTVAVVGDTVVVWGEQKVSGLSSVTLASEWVRPSRGIVTWTAVPHTTWLAYRERSTEQWGVLDARTGDPVVAQALGDLGSAAAVARDGNSLLSAGFVRQEGGDDAVSLVRLSAVELGSGRLIWQREIPTAAPMNVTQLLAHPDVIPVLLIHDEYKFASGLSFRGLEVLMVDKRTGDAGEPASIAADFQGREGVCAAFLLATPSRIIVQANGTLVAYGSTAVETQP